MSAAKPKPFLDSDGDSLLSSDERRLYNALNKHSNNVEHALTDHLFADICLRGAAKNYAEYADDRRHDVRYMMDLRRAAVLYVREALRATDNDVIKSCTRLRRAAEVQPQPPAAGLVRRAARAAVRLSARGADRATVQESKPMKPLMSIDRIRLSTFVRVEHQPGRDRSYLKETHEVRRTGDTLTGVVIAEHDSHGLCYEVQFPNGAVITYDREELHVLEGVPPGPGVFRLYESYGKYPSAELEVIDEGDKARLRIRDPHGKTSIFLTSDDLVWLAEQALLVEAAIKARVQR